MYISCLCLKINISLCSMFGINKMKDRGNCVEKVIFSIVALVCPEYLIDTHTHNASRVNIRIMS